AGSRHTRFPREWSSDVCASELVYAPDTTDRRVVAEPPVVLHPAREVGVYVLGDLDELRGWKVAVESRGHDYDPAVVLARLLQCRSEERRGGERCGCALRGEADS